MRRQELQPVYVVVCSVDYDDRPDDIQGWLISGNATRAQLLMLEGLRPEHWVGMSDLDIEWNCIVFGDPEWIGAHAALAAATKKPHKYPRPEGRKMLFL